MNTLDIDFRALTPNEEGHGYTFDGLRLTEQNLKDICTFKQVPATLIGIDKKFGTSTLTAVLNTLENPSISALEQDGQVQILDPKSSFCSDAQFEQMVALLGDNVDFKASGFGITATVESENSGADFLGDVFTKSLKLDRLPQGGLALQLGLLRLVCTNGARVTSSQFSHVLRNGILDPALAETFRADVANFNLDEYFRPLFMKDGEWLPVSVADYLGMKGEIAKRVDSDTADLYYPMERIEECYSLQGIDISKIAKPLLNKLPAGLTYYQAFQTLTNAAKQIENPTLNDKIAISNWAKPSRLLSLHSTELNYSRIPEWTAQEIAVRMGDRKYEG